MRGGGYYVIAILAHNSTELLAQALYLNARVIVSLNEKPEILRQYISMCREDGPFPVVSPSLHTVDCREIKFILERLTKRQEQVLAALCAGVPRHSVGQKCGLKYHGVSSHIRTLNALFGTSTAAQLVARAYQLGIAQLLLEKYRLRKVA